MAFQVVSDENSDEKQAKKDLLIQIINFFNIGSDVAGNAYIQY